MTKLGRPSIWDQHAAQMAQMYEQEKLSRGIIASYFGTSVQTVTRVLTRHGVIFEDRQGDHATKRDPEEQARINAKISAAKKGVPLGPRKPAETRECEKCHQPFPYKKGRTGERFCSRQCRTDFLAAQDKAGAQAEYELDPKHCPCGTAIDFEYRHTRQFCSPECRATYGAKRQPDPDNHITFNCLRCGKEVTRYKKYGSGASKYCSNECSAKHNRTKQHIVLDDAIVLDSPYEALVYGLLRLWKIPVERADRERAIEFNGDGWYCPDFYLPQQDLWIEVKSFEDDDDRSRYDAWIRVGYQLAVLRRTNLHELRLAENSNTAILILLSIARSQAVWVKAIEQEA